MATQKTESKKDGYLPKSGSGTAKSGTNPQKGGATVELSEAEKLFNEIKKALHGGGTNQWQLPPESKREQCIIPPVIE